MVLMGVIEVTMLPKLVPTYNVISTQYQSTCSQYLCSICAVSCSISRRYLCSISQYSHSISQYFTVFTQYLFVPHRAVLQYRLPSAKEHVFCVRFNYKLRSTSSQSSLILRANSPCVSHKHPEAYVQSMTMSC